MQKRHPSYPVEDIDKDVARIEVGDLHPDGIKHDDFPRLLVPFHNLLPVVCGNV
jgi:hypothetical protein